MRGLYGGKTAGARTVVAEGELERTPTPHESALLCRWRRDRALLQVGDRLREEIATGEEGCRWGARMRTKSARGEWAGKKWGRRISRRGTNSEHAPGAPVGYVCGLINNAVRRPRIFMWGTGFCEAVFLRAPRPGYS